MSFRRRIIKASFGFSGYLSAGTFIKLFKAEKEQNQTNCHSTTPTSSEKRSVTIDGYDLKLVQIFIRHGARTPLHLIRNVKEAEYPVDMILRTVPHTTFNYLERNLDGGLRSISNYELHYLNKYLKFTIGRVMSRMSYLCPLVRMCVYEGLYAILFQSMTSTHIYLSQGGSKVGALSALGQDQMYLIGRGIREQYVKEAGLISGVYNPDEVHIRSTNVNRTVATARCLMAGMFGKESLNSLPEPPIIHIGDSRNDELIPRTSYCPVLRHINHSAMAHGGDAPGLREDRLKIEEALGIDPHDHHKKLNFIDLRDDLVARETHGLPVPEVLKPYREQIEKNAAQIMVWAFNGHKDEERDLAMKLSTGPLMKMMIDNIDNCDNNKTKLYVFSCHDSTLSGILGLLDIYDFKWPPFGSDVRFELYENKNKDRFIRISFNGQDKIVRGCSAELCPLEEFKSSMRPYLVDRAEYEEICESDILERIAKEMLELEKEEEEEDEEDKERSDVPAGM